VSQAEKTIVVVAQTSAMISNNLINGN